MSEPVTPLDCWDEVWIADDLGDVLHILPVDDAVGHELRPDCPCLAHWRWLGEGDLLVAHNPWDGRAV